MVVMEFIEQWGVRGQRGGGWGSGKARAAMHVPIMSTTERRIVEGS
jgi:hypothetical protein